MALVIPSLFSRGIAGSAARFIERGRQPDGWRRLLAWQLPPWRMVALMMAGIVLGDLCNVGLQEHLLGASVIWPGNGVLLGVVLISPQAWLATCLTTGFLCILSWNLVAGHAMWLALAVSFGKTASITLASLMLRRRFGVSTDLARPELMRSFLTIGVLLLPVIPSLLIAPLRAWGAYPNLLATLPGGYLANALGIAIIAPLVVALHREGLTEVLETGRRRTSLLAFVLLALTTTGVFAQSRYPLLFLVMPLLMIVVLRLRLLGATLGCAAVSMIAISLTAAGLGPFNIIDTDPLVRGVLLQVFLATICALSYVSAVRAASHRSLELGLIVRERQARFAEARLRHSEQLHRVLSENAADIISRFSLDGRRLYVSPSVADILGYTPEQLATHALGVHVHPDDREAYFKINEEMRRGLDRLEITYRYARADGSWAWLEARLRLVRDTDGKPREFISNARDITRQKEVESKLAEAMAELSVLATTDGLTGLANRRRFDETLRKEWRRAMRAQTAIGLLMVDVDHFKHYNDVYGHQEGDACLRVIAATLAASTHRPGDLTARYGGEEFCVILPGTTATGARDLAERVRQAVVSLARPHQRNPGSVVTVSLGVASLVPGRDSTIETLLAAADEALYDAKRLGRNRVAVFIADKPPVADFVTVPVPVMRVDLSLRNSA